MNQATALTAKETFVVIKPDIDVRIIEIISHKFDIEPYLLTKEATFSNDLGVDSLDVYEMIMAVEKEFKIDIPDEDAENFFTVGSLIKYVEKKHN
ncbi:MAG: acyl carrier protein [Bacteroidota bacterium]|nr:acyl carrier protein [Bacteroidota bacterium]